MIFATLASGLLVSMLFMPENGFIELMELMDLPSLDGKIHILVVVVVNVTVSAIAELFLWNFIINLIKKINNKKIKKY